MIYALFGIFFIAIMLGVPVAFSLAISSIAYLLLMDIPLSIIPQKMFAGMDSFVLLAVPGFVLAGNLMNVGGITDRIIRFSNAVVGHLRGGLGYVNIIASMFFAGISGTALADTSSLGAILIPAMKKEGYKAEYAVAVTAASSTVGPIIPPSVPMIIVGSLTGLSVSKLFVAGIIPGILLGVGMMLVSYSISKKESYPVGKKSSLKYIFKCFIDSLWALLLTFFIMFGILGGIFTPTEAATIAVLYAMCLGFFVYKDLKISALPAILFDSIIMIAGIMLLVGFANLFAWIMASQRIPQIIANEMLQLTTNKYLIILLINLLLLFIGMFMETIAALLILFPILLNVAVTVGIEAIQFGVLAVLNLILGLSTPPVGVCLFVASDIGKVSLLESTKAITPFLAVNILVLMLVSFFPPITLYLPSFLS